MYIPYWDYFLSLEKDLINCTNYVEFVESNFGTYSINFAKIIMATSAEVDTISKELCFLYLEIGKQEVFHNMLIS